MLPLHSSQKPPKTLIHPSQALESSFMAETKDHEETTLPAKRKPDPSSEDQADYPTKSQKLHLSGSSSEATTQQSSLTEEKRVELQANADPQVEDEEDEEDYKEEEEEEEEEEEDGEDSNGNSEVDPKGKGTMRADKGKGILIEEDEDEDGEDSSDSSSSSSSDGGSEFEDGDSDLSDDPLAEVDLDNILPSRTRRRQVQPGVYIRSDNNQDDDSDDSDD